MGRSTFVHPGLPEMLVSPRPPHKRQRQTAREVYRRQRAIDKAKEAAGKETRAGQILRILSWHWNVTQSSPTAYELYVWAINHGEKLLDVYSVRPRLTDLVRRGLVEPRSKRRCAVSRQIAHVWAIREAGSVEPRG